VTKALQPDDLIAHYRVIRALGAGGMGEVYLARDSTLDRQVALKVLPQMAQDDDRVARFVLEAKSASSLSHPHIITVYEIGCQPVISGGTPRPDKVHYIAMELVDGDSLADIIHESKADLKTLLGYLAQAADGLAKAHASGIVHRDLKPGNIMVSKDGYAKVLDFGLAKLVEKAVAPDATLNVVTKQALTMEGMIVGTIGYMAPEQILGRPVDHRSDIFSFGCILYEAVTHQRPFAADSQFEALQKIVHEHPVAIESYVADSPVELRQLVARCLAKNPDERVPSMKDVAAELRRISSSYDVLARAAAHPTDQTMFFPTPSGSIPPPSGSGAQPGAYPPGYPPYPSHAFPQDATLPSGMAVPQGLTAPSGVAAPSGVPVAEKKKPIALIAGAAVLVLALVGFGVYKFGPGGKSGGLSEDALSAMKIAPVLSGEILQSIAVSPEGRFAAHVSVQNGKYRLQIRQITTQVDREIVPPQELAILALAFTPDGDRLWYCMLDKENQQYSSLYEVPSLGGAEPTRKVTDADTEPTFSPDGKSIAFIRGMPTEKKAMLMVAQEDGTGAKALVTVEAPVDNVLTKPRWSPDGKQIAVVHRVAGKPNIVAIDVASAQQQQVGTWEGPSIDSVAWLGATGFVVAGAPAPGPSQLWHVTYPAGERRRLTNDDSDYTFVSTSADGKTIAARRTQRTGEIWEVPVAGSPADMKSVTQGKENISSLAAAGDGTLLYNAPQEETMTLWAFKPGSGKRSIAPKGLTVLSHRMMRGQEATAFTAFGADLAGNIHRVNIDGSNPKQLTKGPGERLVAVTPDSKFVLYNTPQAPQTLMLIPSDGAGSPRTLATDYIGERGRVGGEVIFSRDGKIVSYQKVDTGQQQVVTVRTFVNFDDGKTIATRPVARGEQITPDGSLSYITVGQTAEKTPLSTVYKTELSGGAPQKLFDMADTRIDRVIWVDDKTAIVAAFSTKTSTSNLWRWTVGSTKPVPLTAFPSGLIFEFAISPDGKMIYFTQGSNNRDIIKITGLVK
jgi:serine/threonine protein kinase/Tol biopolymer transport system component